MSMCELFTPEQVAAMLKVEPQTLRQWRREGTGPKWIKLGREGPTSPVRYRREDVAAYVDSLPKRPAS